MQSQRGEASLQRCATAGLSGPVVTMLRVLQRALVLFLAQMSLSAVLAIGTMTPCGLVETGGEAQEATVAFTVLADILRELEPSLPRLRNLAESEPDDALRYLKERGFIDRTVDPAEFNHATWQGVLDELFGLYGVPSIVTRGWDHEDELLADAQEIVDRILAVIRPVVLLAWDPDDDDRIAFVGLVLNWSPYPRLVVMRPPDGWTMSDGARELAGRVSLCGAAVRDWVSAPAPVARALFVQHADDAPMYLVGSDPERDGWPYRVPAGEEIAVFAFEHPEVADLERFSAVFAAEPLGIMHVVRLLPQVRTNLSPMGFVRAMQTPPRRE